MEKEVFLVYCSPNGSTRHVARIIGKQLEREEIPFTELALGRTLDWTPVMNRIRNAGDRTCIIVGSPVYKGLAVPPVMDFISSLPEVEKSICLPFVTWGGVSSGIALWQMGRALAEKGYRIAGAVKVLSEHSAMWSAGEPPGKGHPDRADDQAVADMTATLLHRFNLQQMPALALERLDYQPAAVSSVMKEKTVAPEEIFKKWVDEYRCIQCGICEEQCPMDAILLDPFPEIYGDCFDCLNCIRSCPEEAFLLESPRLPDLVAAIGERAEKSSEQRITTAFLGE